MGAIKNFYKRQFQVAMLSLEHDSASAFCVGCFQKNLSPLPITLIRGIVFLGCLAILLSSIILTTSGITTSYWPIYLTHWGLLAITITSALGFVVAAKAYLQGPIDATFGLPWYIKAYWASYNISIPLALYITIFYWSFLSNDNQEYAISLVLDIFIHAINSVLMLVLLMTARHPMNILHFYFVIIIAVVYIIFSAIYYACGGTDPFGNLYIYPVLDWTNPGPTVVMLVLSIILAILLHVLMVLLAIARDALARHCRKENMFTIAS